MSNKPVAAARRGPVSAPVAPRRVRRGLERPAEELLFDATYAIRRRAVYMKARWIPDAAAEVDASVWAAIQAGEDDLDRLWDVARAAAVRQRRWEQRQHRNDALAPDRSDPALTEDTSDEVVAQIVRRCDAKRAIAQLSSEGVSPSPAALEWALRVAGMSYGERLPSRVKMAGQRWAMRVRAQLEECDAVA